MRWHFNLLFNIMLQETNLLFTKYNIWTVYRGQIIGYLPPSWIKSAPTNTSNKHSVEQKMQSSRELKTGEITVVLPLPKEFVWHNGDIRACISSVQSHSLSSFLEVILRPIKNQIASNLQWFKRLFQSKMWVYFKIDILITIWLLGY